MEHDFDFVAIGDTVTDAFIKLHEAKVHCNINHEEYEISMRFGDKIPYEAAYVIPAVGNSANAAVAAARLGMKTALVTNLGGDYFGTEAIHALEKEKISTEFIAIHNDKPTNYHYVLWYESDRTILIKHEQYQYRMPDIGSPKWVYLSSLGDHSEAFHDDIADYLDAHPEIHLAFQPGTFQMKMGVERMKRFYERAAIFFCNKEEAERILGIKPTPIVESIKLMRNLGPKLVVITDGPAGAYCYDGNEIWSSTQYPDPKPPYERTGAGDAFSSTFAIAIAGGQSMKDALRWGSVNSMSVVQQVGARAGLLTKPDIDAFLEHAPRAFVQTQVE